VSLPEGLPEFLDGVREAWGRGDFAAVEACWDADDPLPMYQAEEEESVHLGWPALRDYWQRTAQANERIRVVYSNLVAKPLGADQYLVAFDMHFDLKMRSRPKAIGGDNRTFAIVRLGAGGWRFAAWIEAPLAPILYMRRLYERAATVGFPG
jgi:hypothetical protein